MKKLMVSAMMALLGGTLFAAGDMYLYWMVAEDATVKDAQGQTVSMDDMTASIHYTDASGANTGLLNLYDSSYVDIDTKEIGIDNVKGFPVFAEVTGYENYSFFVELKSDAGVFRSTTASYSSLASYISSMSGTDYPSEAFGFSSFSAVPEPTSGLLILLGVAGLALRRRRA